MATPLFDGNLPVIIRNSEKLYEGNLVSYFRAIFNNAQNLRHPYHNFRHMFHVVWLCYSACRFYRNALNKRQMRNLLIAAMFHDFDHSGILGNDDLNIARAVRGFVNYALPEDQKFEKEIIFLIEATEYPHRISSEKLPLSGLILRDADLAQALSSSWIQQIIFGLAEEWGRKPIEILKEQVPFQETLAFETEWAQEAFPPEKIREKVNEVFALLSILEEKPAVAA